MIKKEYIIPINDDILGVEQLIIEVEEDGIITFTDGEYNDYGGRKTILLNRDVLPELIRLLTEIKNDPT